MSSNMGTPLFAMELSESREVIAAGIDEPGSGRRASQPPSNSPRIARVRGDLKATTRYALVVDSIFGGAEPVEVEEEDAAGAAAPVQATRAPEQATWVAIRLTDSAGDPVKGVKYTIELPDGSTKDGKLDDNGLAKVESKKAGMCKISFPEIDAGDWDLQGVKRAAAPAAAAKLPAKKAYFGTIKG